MKPLPTAIIAALVVALAVLGYFYYQRTNEDITIRIPK
jgi:RsiW-degrading membrane proteinase PrsW (M82 family)